MKQAEIYLGYFKQGDDMSDCLANSDNVVEAMRLHAERLESCVLHLRELADEIEKSGKVNECEMDADTHMISIVGPEDLINDLTEKGLVDESMFDDEEDDFDDDEDDDM